MTASTLSTPRTGIGRVVLAALLAAVLTGIVNGAIAIIAVAAGVTQTMQLMPPVDVVFSVVASVVGAVGWTIVDRSAAEPRRVMRVLAPAVLIISFVPDVLLALATAGTTGIAPILTLALMHVTTIGIAIAVYARLLPLKRSA